MCALAFEGQGPCAAGWCINPPLQVPGGQALAELRVDADPMLQSIDGLSTGLIQIVGQPGDFVNLGTLDGAGLFLGFAQLDAASYGSIFVGNPPDASNRLFRVESVFGGTSLYPPRGGQSVDAIDSVDVNLDGTADRLDLSIEPRRLHLSLGNPGGLAEERNHIYELVLEEGEYGHITNLSATGGAISRIGDLDSQLLVLPGSNPPLYVQNLYDLDGDSNADEVIVLRRDLGQPDYVIEFIQDVSTVPVVTQVFQIPNGAVPNHFIISDYDLDLDLDICIQMEDQLPIVFVNDGLGVFVPLPGPLYLGTGEDFKDVVSVNGAPATCSGIVEATGGDVVSIFACSPNHTFDFMPYILIGQEFVPGFPPPGIPLFGVAINPGGTPAPFLLVDGGAPSPIGPLELVLPGGNLHSFLIPPGLTGLSLMLQSLVISPNTSNGFFAASYGTEVRFN